MPCLALQMWTSARLECTGVERVSCATTYPGAIAVTARWAISTTPSAAAASVRGAQRGWQLTLTESWAPRQCSAPLQSELFSAQHHCSLSCAALSTTAVRVVQCSAPLQSKLCTAVPQKRWHHLQSWAVQHIQGSVTPGWDLGPGALALP